MYINQTEVAKLQLQPLDQLSQAELIAIEQGKQLLLTMDSDDFSLFPIETRIKAAELLDEEDEGDYFDYRPAHTNVEATHWSILGHEVKKLVLIFVVNPYTEYSLIEHCVFYLVEKDNTLNFIKDSINYLTNQ